MQEVPNWPSEQDATFPHARIFIDLGMGFRRYPLAGLTIRRDLQTFLPEQVRAVEGISAATGQAILAPVDHGDSDLEGEILSDFTEGENENDFDFPLEFNVDAPPGVQEGDVLVAFQDQSLGDWPPDPPQGGTEWHLLAHLTAANVRLAAFWKVAGPNEPSQYEFTMTDDDVAKATICFVRGATGETPIAEVLPGPDDSDDAPETWFVDTPSTTTSSPTLELRAGLVILNNCDTPDAILPTEDTTMRAQSCKFFTHFFVASRISTEAEETGERRFFSQVFTHRRISMTVNVPLADYPPAKRLHTASFPGHWSPFKDLVPVLSGARFTVTSGLRSEQGDAMPTVLVGEVVEENGTTDNPELDLQLTDDSPLLQEPYRPQAIIGDSLLVDGSDNFIFSPGLSATWVIADILARAGFDTYPPADDDTVFQATLLGSAEQNVGGNISQPGFPFGPSQLPYEASNFDQDGPAEFLPAEFAPLGASDLRGFYFTTRNVSIDGGNGGEAMMVEFWVDFTSSSGSNPDWNIRVRTRDRGFAFLAPFSLNVRVNASTSEVFADSTTNDRASMGVSKVVETPGPVRVYVSIESTSGLNYTARITICDSVDCTSDTVTGSLGPEGTAFHVGQVEVFTNDAITGGVRVVDHPGEPEPVDFTPDTDLDESLNELVATPQVGNDTGWEVINDIASAELGAFWFSETGVPTFRNRASLAGIGQPVHDVFAARRFSELRWEISTSQVYNAVAVPFTPTGVDASGRVVWSANEQIRILGNGTRVFDVELDDPTLGVSVRFSANSQRNGEGTDVSDDLQVEQLTQPSENRASFIIRNTTGGSAWLVDAEGRPDVEVVAFAAVVQDRPVDAIAAANPESRQTLQVNSNDWVQTSQQATNVADFLASQVSQPIPTIPAAIGKPDTRIQQGDIVRLIDPVHTNLSHRGLVAGYSNTQTPGRFEQVLTVRLLIDLWADFDSAWNPFTRTNSTLRDFETEDTTSSPLTVTAPDNQDGDLLIAVVTVRGDFQVTPPAGFELFHVFESGDTVIVRTFVWTKTADSEPASYSFTTPSGSHMIGGVWALRGHNPELSPQIHTTRQPQDWDTNRYRIPKVFPVLEGDTAIWWVAGANGSISTGGQIAWTFDDDQPTLVTISPLRTSSFTTPAGLLGAPLNRRYARLELQAGADAEATDINGPTDVDPSADFVLLTNSVYRTWQDFNDHWAGRTWDDFDEDPTDAPEDGGE